MRNMPTPEASHKVSLICHSGCHKRRRSKEVKRLVGSVPSKRSTLGRASLTAATTAKEALWFSV